MGAHNLYIHVLALSYFKTKVYHCQSPVSFYQQPVFLTKEERAAQAIARRKEAIEEQRKQADEERRAQRKFADEGRRSRGDRGRWEESSGRGERDILADKDKSKEMDAIKVRLCIV